jgi:hypothetical protein
MSFSTQSFLLKLFKICKEVVDPFYFVFWQQGFLKHVLTIDQTSLSQYCLCIICYLKYALKVFE